MNPITVQLTQCMNLMKFKYSFIIFLNFLILAKQVIAQQATPTINLEAQKLEQAINSFLMSQGPSVEEEFNKFMQAVTPDCTNSLKLQQIKNGAKLNDLNELYDFACVSRKILTIKSVQDPQLVKKVIEKIASLENSSKQLCNSHSTCSNEFSCLPLSSDDYVYVIGGRGAILQVLADTVDELSSAIKIANIKSSKSCEYNYECESLSCIKKSNSSVGSCAIKKTCRLGKDLETVKTGGKCSGGLEIDHTSTCYSHFNEENFISNYKFFKEELGKKQCGEFDNKNIMNELSALALDLRAFELMIQYAQDLSKKFNGFKGGELDHYHKIPQKVQSDFLGEYVSKRNLQVTHLNKKLTDFTKYFSNVLNAQGESTNTVNFYDIKIIEKEMKSQKESSIYYIQLYSEWIKAQQEYYAKNTKTINTYMIEESGPSSFMHFLGLLAKTKEDDKSAPLFSNSKGKKNDRRWFLSLYLPKDSKTYDSFKKSPYIDYKELTTSGFGPHDSKEENAAPYKDWNIAWTATADPMLIAANMIYVSTKSNKPHLLDPILPPNGCQIIDSTHNDCNGNQGWLTEGVNDILGVKGFNGTFDKDLDKTIKALYDAWYNAVKEHYTLLAKNVPANTIIDPELNFYAGCFQYSDSKKFKDDPGMQDFYKNFCSNDLNRNGTIEENEKTQEITLNRLTRKILSFSLAYSFNKNKRPVMFGMSRSYKDEFKQDESHKTEKKAEWIDLDLGVISPDTKFYNFAYGVKKNFLNRMRNRYFFLGSYYALISQNFNKQLACIQGSMGEFSNVNVLEKDLSPTPTPKVPNATPNTGNNNNNSNSGVSSSNHNSNNNQNSTAQNGGTSTAGSPLPNLQANNSRNRNSSIDLNSANTKSNVTNDNKDNEEQKPSIVLGGTGSIDKNSLESSANDYASGSNVYSGSIETSQASTHSNDAQGLSEDEYSKLSSSLNSNSDPQFSDNDTIFTQITRRYVKNYGKVFTNKRHKSNEQ